MSYAHVYSRSRQRIHLAYSNGSATAFCGVKVQGCIAFTMLPHTTCGTCVKAAAKNDRGLGR